MSTLKALSLVYLASASAFAVVIALHSDARWAEGVRGAARVATPVVRSTAETLNEKAVKPSVAWASQKGKEFFDWLELRGPQVAQQTPPKKPAPIVQAQRTTAPARAATPARAPASPVLRPAITEPQSKRVTAPPTLELAPQAAEPELTPAPDANPPSAAELARVLSHMKLSLTKELF
ncbi:MAG TPA: hypothetical protein VGC27_10455 [Rhizomicrobium sp.]